MVTEADRPRVFAWVVLDDSGEPARHRHGGTGSTRSPVAAAGSGSVSPRARRQLPDFRDHFRVVRHLLIPAAAAVIFLFSLWGIIHPNAYTLVNLLPFTALGWLALGIIAVSTLPARRHASLQVLGKVFLPDETDRPR